MKNEMVDCYNKKLKSLFGDRADDGEVYCGLFKFFLLSPVTVGDIESIISIFETRDIAIWGADPGFWDSEISYGVIIDIEKDDLFGAVIDGG